MLYCIIKNKFLNTTSKLFLDVCVICLGIITISGCSSQKDTAANRGLQNLSAKYNYIYNSNISLNIYQESLFQTHRDNYNNFLAIYIAPATIDYLNSDSKIKELDDIASKAQAIIAEKNLSNYIDEAYILLGKTSFYRGDYFNAVAYFDYTAKTYKNKKNIYLNALNWKARSLMQLNDFSAATKTLDTVKIYLDSVKSNKAEPLITLAQMSIYKYKYKEAIPYLESAIKETNQIQSRTRWPYILAQLYEHEKEYDLSLRNYTKVENSNAPFEMYFNAKLSKIRINDALNEVRTNRKTALLKLLKDDKNLDYTDQIYYEVAEDYYADNNFEKAKIYYQLSAQNSKNNPYQKGLSYLKIAELNFRDLKDYVNAKLYYDSAIITLPKNYPNYESILIKGQNLGYLTERYQIISKQDTLQAIAKLNKQDRAKKLELMFEPQKDINSIPTNRKLINNEGYNKVNKQNNSTFYFSNFNAISAGFSDFKKKWGNRLLEDNWRQSVKSSGQINQQNQINALGIKTEKADSSQSILGSNKAEDIKKYETLIPLTPEQLTKSNQQIINSYFEIAAFYQQVINDQQEAIKVYELLLKRFPQNNHLETIYYSLYLSYRELDQEKANFYKNIVLTKYPNSVFAKTILDPNFSFKQNALDSELNKLYNNIFTTYLEKDFEKVISSVNDVNQRFPNNNLQAQFDYLKAIAIGRTQNVDNLLTVFNQITTHFPEDQLINPLVKNHIIYINNNIKSFKARKIALIDIDPLETPFISKQIVNSTVKQSPSTTVAPIIENKIVDTPERSIITAETEAKNAPNKLAKDNLFSTADSKIYYYVISVADVSLSVSSSRFGVGQFNRGNYTGANLKHQLTELDEDQLIYVGDFDNLEKVKGYYQAITSQLPKIMKIPATSYISFYISKENYNILKDKETINKYLEFFKSNY